MQSRAPVAATSAGRRSGLVVLALVVVLVATGAVQLRSSHVREPVYPGPGVTRTTWLSEYFPGLEGSPGDTPVYILDSGQPGGTVLVMGGVHPTESAGMLAAVLVVENAEVDAGRVIVITHANESGFTVQPSEDAYLPFFEIETPGGPRLFRGGDRLTSPIRQGPDPEAYAHYPSGQVISGSESRNLNRAFPGRPDGTLTEKVAYGITQLIETEGVDVVIDLHESSVAYPVTNVIVAHPDALDLATRAVLQLAFQGVSIGVDRSPEGLRGFTHRELGALEGTMAVLFEAPNALMDWTRGATTPELLLEGADPLLLELSKRGRLYTAYGPEGYPIEVRVGRHIAGVSAVVEVYSGLHPDRAIGLKGLPGYQELVTRGMGPFLHPPEDAHETS